MDELLDACTIERNDILKALPEIFQNSALLWYRNNKDMWDSYVDFRRDFRNTPPPLSSLALVPETAYHAKKKFDISHEACTVNKNPVTKTKPTQGVNERGCTIHGEANNTQRRTETKIVKPNVQKEKCELKVKFQTPVNNVRRMHVDSICWNCEKGGIFQEWRRPKTLRCFYCKRRDGKLTVDSAESQPKKLKMTPEDWQGWLRTIANFSGSVQTGHIEIEIYGITFSALLDTGATMSMVGKRLAEHLRRNGNVPFKHPMKIRMADGSQTLLQEYYSSKA
ncbi:hypothetical protein J6590_028409 [Homalodisca vitripennis]|nr:hypothetical protein J6590_028409 [Homalodisca vitripennis]